MNLSDFRIRSVAVVAPRFGSDLGGGAEALLRGLALELAKERPGGALAKQIEIWTTCARDHRTWENFHPPGASVEDGLLIRRFPVDERDLETFIKAEFAFRDGRPLSLDQQLDWLASGVNSKALYAHIAEHGSEFDLIIFGPYLFPTSFWGGR